eukprot:scaffold11749_cov118-Skeletonema_dohrnii-CCMP3373.AAC.2
MKLLIAAAAILSGHVAHATQNFTRALSGYDILPDFCADGGDSSLCECKTEGYGNPVICASELDTACRTEGLQRWLPEGQVKVQERIFCPFSACVIKGAKSNEGCSCDIISNNGSY